MPEPILISKIILHKNCIKYVDARFYFVARFVYFWFIISFVFYGGIVNILSIFFFFQRCNSVKGYTCLKNGFAMSWLWLGTFLKKSFLNILLVYARLSMNIRLLDFCIKIWTKNLYHDPKVFWHLKLLNIIQ